MASEGRTPPRDLEAVLLREVEQLSSSIGAAKRVDDAICALHSLALLLFPVDSSALAGVLDEPYKEKVLDISVPPDDERESWKHAFYEGAAFPIVARVLIYNIGLDWLTCFPRTARIQVYDSFFVNGPMIEIIQALVPCLTADTPSKDEVSITVCSNVERLLALLLFENGGIHKMARELIAFSVEKYSYTLLSRGNLSLISRMAQLLTSIPDKARLTSPAAFSSHFFFKQITSQLLDVAEERAEHLFSKMDILNKPIEDVIFSFIGEIFARICRRGSAGTLLAIATTRLLDHVRICLSSSLDSSNPNGFELNPKSVFWSSLIGHVKDLYATEKLLDELLRQLAGREITDEEAYWMLWMLYHKSFMYQVTSRALFSEKLLLCKVYPFCCLKWILHLSVFGCPPKAPSLKTQNTQEVLATVLHLLVVWSKREFVQSAPMEKQAYVTAAVGLCLEQISKEELETTRDVMNLILQGVSCRLESPIDIVRKMASSIALTFSKVVDPNNPLYLDDSQTETIDWEFGLISSKKGTQGKYPASHRGKYANDESRSSGKATDLQSDEINKKDNKLNTNFMLSGGRQIDPDEIIDPALISEDFQDENYSSGSEDSEASSDSSLQPYDMTDDDNDLRRKISQISDLFTALRKPDDPDGVEQALSVAEQLVRTSPDELQHSAGDLVKTLIYIHCSDLAVDGEEESAEKKRQNALIALLVTCPFESADVMTRLLYSSNLDVSQRILVIDVMTEAALELSHSKTSRINQRQTNLISSLSDCKPWYLPSNDGPLGSGPWEEVSERETPLSWSLRFERTVPSRPGQVKVGKSRQWSFPADKTQDSQLEWSHNRFPLYAAAFMIPTMQGYDKRKHGVDFVGRDFIVLGKLIHMLGVCMKCVAMHPEASALAPLLLDMLSSRAISHHPEAYVRRSVLFAASCILVALHPSFVASALMEGQQNISIGLDWIRSWAFLVADTDPDAECTTMAMTCLQLHAEMALQTSRTLDSADTFLSRTSISSSTLQKDIILPVGRITEL